MRACPPRATGSVFKNRVLEVLDLLTDNYLVAMNDTIISTKSALVKSRIPGVEYVINPYLGCTHACSYCYAVFMRQHSHGHQDAPWGSFVEVKANMPEILEKELRRRRLPPSSVMLSSVCDPYQPAEARHGITRRCIELLAQYGWEIEVLTRSPLVLRDLDALLKAKATVGFSIPTENDRIRRLTEPDAPSIQARIEALRQLHDAGISTWAFLAPLMPMDPDRLHEMLAPVVDHVLVSALNHYDLSAEYLRSVGLGVCMTRGFAPKLKARLREVFGGLMDGGG